MNDLARELTERDRAVNNALKRARSAILRLLNCMKNNTSQKNLENTISISKNALHKINRLLGH